LEIIFSPPKAGEYDFQLTCKSGINRKFKINCRGVGVHPQLELSHQVIRLPATALYDTSICGEEPPTQALSPPPKRANKSTAPVAVQSQKLYMINSHISANEFTHPVPRIGKGAIAPVGPTSFEFVPPENCPVHISPTVGTLEPGKKSSYQFDICSCFISGCH
jgi:hypothetical protein